MQRCQWGICAKRSAADRGDDTTDGGVEAGWVDARTWGRRRRWTWASTGALMRCRRSPTDHARQLRAASIADERPGYAGATSIDRLLASGAHGSKSA